MLVDRLDVTEEEKEQIREADREWWWSERDEPNEPVKWCALEVKVHFQSDEDAKAFGELLGVHISDVTRTVVWGDTPVPGGLIDRAGSGRGES